MLEAEIESGSSMKSEFSSLSSSMTFDFETAQDVGQFFYFSSLVLEGINVFKRFCFS